MSSELLTEVDDANDPKLRLLICKVCHSIQPLPDYQSRDIDGDETLMARVAEHQYPGSQRGHDMNLVRVSETSWNDPVKRKFIMTETSKEIGLGEGEGLGVELYAVRDNFSEDAMKCWRFKHGRTTNCADYMSDKMKILADSRAERKDLGLDPKTRAHVKLCSFCPMHSIAMQVRNKRKGLYN